MANTWRVRWLAIGLLAASCSSHVCTKMGCFDGLTVSFAQLARDRAFDLPFAVHVCVDGNCTDHIVTQAPPPSSCVTVVQHGTGNGASEQCVPQPPGSYSALITFGSIDNDLVMGPGLDHDVTAQVKGRTGAILTQRSVRAHLAPTYPNGKACGVGCHSATVPITQ